MFFIYLYSILTILAQPFLKLYLASRLRQGKEDPKRYKERLGIINLTRPKGTLLWMHAASVGEINLIIPIINEFYKIFPNINFLITTVTTSSATIFANAKLPNAVHQYFPVDTPKITKKFLNHWQPNLAIFAESELWPNILITTHNHKVPLILVNARLSNRSFKKWKLFKQSINYLLNLFAVILPATAIDTERFKYFSSTNIHYIGNIKNAAPVISYDSELLELLKNKIEGRHVFVCASTHKGEEAILMEAHLKLKQRFDDLLTIIIPRHISRKHEIENIANKLNLTYLIHSSHKQSLSRDTEIYIVDSIGELGTFYRLAPFAFVGASLMKIGGHNILEPAKVGCAVITGPNMFNFTEVVDKFINANAITIVQNKADLIQKVISLFENPDILEQLQHKALEISQQQNNVIQETIGFIAELLPNPSTSS